MKNIKLEGFIAVHLGDTVLLGSTSKRKHRKGCAGGCDCDDNTWYYPIYFTKKGARDNSPKGDKIIKIKLLVRD